MIRSFVLSDKILEKLTADDKYENIILGTGTLARDMQKKLRLLNLKAPFLVGGKDDPANGILHYESLGRLENLQNCRFISCFDMDELPLIAPAQAVVNRLVGSVSNNHPRFIIFSTPSVIGERVPDLRLDTHVHSCRLRGGLSYTVYGDAGDAKAFKIHLLGACTVSGVYSHAERMMPEILYDKLQASGFNGVVYSWGQTEQSAADNLILLLRDIRFHKPDLVILFANMVYLNPVKGVPRNALAVRTSYDVHYSIPLMESFCSGEISNGFDHDVNPYDVGVTQFKIFEALSKQFGFEFWHVVHPNHGTLSEAQARLLTGLSAGYLARERKIKDDTIEAINSPRVKDYTGIFDDADDIFSMFSDRAHYTGKGSEALARKTAEDILANFSPGI